MKYEQYLDYFISPVSGKSSNSEIIPLTEDYILVGNASGYAQPSPTLIDIKLEIISLNSLLDHRLVPAMDATFVINTRDDSLPNAQVIEDISEGMVKIIEGGLFARAIPDTDYATVDTLEKLRDEAQKSADEAALSAKEAADSETAAENSATEAAKSAADALASANAADLSEANAKLDADAAKISADNAAASARDSSDAAGDAQDYMDAAEDAMRDARKAAADAVISSAIAGGASGAAIGAAAGATAAAAAAGSASSSARSSAGAASGSAAAASSSATGAASSAAAASTSETNAANSATSASGSAVSAASTLATFLSENLVFTGAIIASALVNADIPTIFADNAVFPGNGGITVPHGTIAERLGALGTIRLNTESGVFEGTVNGTTWVAFNTSSGTVATINTGTGLTGGPITSSGTISLANTAVTPGTYSLSTTTVDQQGRITSMSSGSAVTSLVAGTGLSGGTITATGTIAIANTAVTPGTYTNMTGTVGATGQLTAASDGPAPVLIGGSTMTGALVLSADPVTGLGAATKQYVDAISQGLFFKNICYVATTAQLAATYSNGTLGVGATLTNSGALSAFVQDGAIPPANSRILVKNQSSQFQNGIYTLTTAGSGSVAWVLTRSTDYDQASEIRAGDIVPIQNGAVNYGTSWLQLNTVSTLGTSAIDFNQYTFNQTQFLQTANNLSDLTSASTARTNLGVSTTNHCVLLGNSTGSISSLANTTSGKVLISVASLDPVWSTSLTALTQINSTLIGVQDAAPGTSLSVCGNTQIGFAPGTTAPTASLVVSSRIGIGTSSPSYPLEINNSRTYSQTAYIGGTQATTNDTTSVVHIETRIRSLTNITFALQAFISPLFDATPGLTITNGAGLWIDAGSNFSGTVTNAYGIFINAPGYGTNNCAIYGGNASIGYTGVSPPTNGLLVSGQTLIGASSATGIGAKLEVTTANGAYGILHTQGGIRLATYLDSGATTGAQFGTTSNHRLGFFVAGGAPILNVCTPSGIASVGINTQNPASPLHLVAAAGALQDYGAFTVDTASSGGSGLSMGYDTANGWSWIKSRTAGSSTKDLYINSVLRIGTNGPSGNIGATILSSFGPGLILTVGGSIGTPSNKLFDLGTTSLRFNTAYCASVPTGTSRLAKSRTECPDCKSTMMRGTGTTITLGEHADYIPVFCLECGHHKVEALQHLPKHRLGDRRPPKVMKFLGFKVCQYSGNSRGIQVKFRYDKGKQNSTFLSDHEHEEFLSLGDKERASYLKALALREWHALEEVRLMEEECLSLQSGLDDMVNHLVGSNLVSL